MAASITTPGTFPRWVRALYSWSGEEKRDLGFIEGDVIEVLNTGDGNWWLGKLRRNKVVGLFPCNFVEAIEDKSTPPPERNNSSISNISKSSSSSRISREPTPEITATIKGRRSVSPRPESPWNGMRYQGDIETIKSMARSSFIMDERPTSRASYKSRDDILKDITAELSRGSSSVSRFSSIASSSRFHRDDDINNSHNDLRNYNHSIEQPTEQYNTNFDNYSDSDSDSDHSFAPSFTPSRGNSVLKVKENEYQGYDSYDNSYSDYNNSNYQSDYNSNFNHYQPSDLSDLDDMPNTPPLPPQHSVPVSRMNSTASTPPQASPRGPLDRTPSPLRNAMDDVLESLDNMGDLSRTTSMRSDDESLSATITKSQRSKLSNSHSGLSHSTNDTYNLSHRFSKISLANPQYEEDDGYIPFAPNSYDNIATINSQTPSEWPMSRTDTYRSTNSSINTNALSVISHSTTPTTISNFSSSNGSMKYHSTIPAMRSSTTSSTSNDSRSSLSGRPSDFIDDVPVRLPDAKASKEKKPVKSLKLRRSAGFIRKFFSSNDGSISDNEDDNSMIDSHALKRTKSHSSRKSISSTSSRVSRVRNSLRKVSAAKSFFSNRNSTPQHQTINWMEAKRDLHRSNTITKNEADQRKLQLELSGITIREPLKYLSLSAGNETLSGPSKGQGKRDFAKQDFSAVDETISALTSWPKLMTPAVFASSRIGRQFEYDIERLRAIFDLCASKFTWEQALPDDDEDEEDEPTSTGFSRIMQTKRATSQELAHCVKSMCEALDIPCDIVKGHLKVPGENFEIGVPKVNHYWNVIIINDEYRFLDVSLANPSFAKRDCYYKMETEPFSRSTSTNLRVNHFYFLTTPLDLIYTHVPYHIEDQHIIPSISPEDALVLPIAGPELFKYNMKLIDFHTGLTKLNNLEIVDLTLSVQHGIELLAEVVVGNITNSEDCIKIPGLAQAYWEDNKRFFRIKGYIPEPYSQGVLNIYVGERGSLQSISRNTLGLAYSIGITHSGENAQLELLTRHPTPHCKRQDLYVKQPQCKKLLEGNSYLFQVKQHPANGITSGSGFARVKIGIQSPSGRITKMHITEGNQVHGTWEASIKCSEIGTWRGLVLADSGNAWSVFAEWYCM